MPTEDARGFWPGRGGVGCLLMLIVLSGCSYGKARLLDAKEIFTFNVTVDQGWYFSARATDFMSVSFGYLEEHRPNHLELGRNSLPEIRGQLLPERHHGPPSTIRLSFFALELQKGSPATKEDPYEMVRIMGFPVAWPAEGRVSDVAPEWVDRFDVTVTAHPLLFGIQVGFSPGQFVDFLGGIFGLDLAGDDPEEAQVD